MVNRSEDTEEGKQENQRECNEKGEEDLGDITENQWEIREEENKKDQTEQRKEMGMKEVKIGDRIKAKIGETEERIECKILSRAGKASSGKWSDSYNIYNMGTGREEWIDLRNFSEIEKITEEEEILLVWGVNERALEAKVQELNSWEENEVYEEVERKNQKCVSTKWIITEKEREGQSICKARLVARGFEEKEVGYTDAPTCAPETLKMALSIIVSMGWRVKTLDIKTAYLQGKEIEREVFLRPPKEARTDKIWKLRKTVYGLKDAAKAWYDTVKQVILELGGRKSKLENTLFSWHNEEENIVGIMCTHVDDFCYGGNEFFEREVIGKMRKSLRVGSEEVRSFKYIGICIEQKMGEIMMDQQKYTLGIENIEKNFSGENKKLTEEELTEYRSIIGQMNWVAQHTRPDMAFQVSDLSRKFKDGKEEDMKELRKVVKRMKENVGRIRIGKVNLEGAWIQVYTDASYSNVEETKSQIGYIISLEDGTGKRAPIFWKSRKARRVARSTIEAETLSMIEGVEAAMYLQEVLKELWRRNKVPIKIRTDSKTLEKTLKTTYGVESRRLRIDLAVLREMLMKKEIDEVEWVGTKEQIADVLTKKGVKETNILEYVRGM